MTYLLAGCLWLVGQCVAMMAALKGESWTCAEGVVLMLLGAALTIWRSSHGPVSHLQDHHPSEPQAIARIHGRRADHTSPVLRVLYETACGEVCEMPGARGETRRYADHDEHGYDSRGVQRTVLEMSRGVANRSCGERRTNPGETEVAT